MCLFRPPKPPALPEEKPVDSAIEKVSKAPVVGKRKKRATGTMTAPTRANTARGTRSLQIALQNTNSRRGDLNY